MSLSKEQIVAQSLVSWIASRINADKDIARDKLPKMDIEYFLRSLSKVEGFHPSEYSIALAGFNIDNTSLRTLANHVGMSDLQEIADDLHAAAGWRNNRRSHPRIIALGMGSHPGVHTLKHFAQPHSKELAAALLDWALICDEFVSTGAQSRLLQTLKISPELEPLRSLDSLANFFTHWSEYKTQDPNDAPRRALPSLGLLADPNLFSDLEKLEQRLVSNLKAIKDIIGESAATMAKKRSRVEHYKNQETKIRLLEIYSKMEALRRNPSVENRANLTLEEANQIFRPPPDKLESEEIDTEDNGDNEDRVKLDRNKLTSEGADALLDNNQGLLEAFASELERAWDNLDDHEAKSIDGEITYGENTWQFNVPFDPNFFAWLHVFCTPEIWGGLIESKEPSLELAIKHYTTALQEPQFVTPDSIVKIDGKSHSLQSIMDDFDREFYNVYSIDLNLGATWREFSELRTQIIENIDYIVCFPLNWLGGRQNFAQIIEKYLSLSSRIYSTVQNNYHLLSELSYEYAQIILEGLLALDIVQFRIELENGQYSHKAILLPTHPLHLWRIQRLTAILRGLGSQISDSDRKAIKKEVMNPEHFLNVICLGTIPEGKGINQLLPIANEIFGLATFENLQNAISGPDGAKKLSEIVYRYSIISKFHTRPLRIAILNPPEPGKLMAQLVNVLNQRRETTLPAIRVEMYCTPSHAHRIQLSMRITDERDLLEDKIASGRLQFKVHEKPKEIQEILAELKDHPVHILAIFDEASIHIRRYNVGHLLPMSPFCVRNRIIVDKMKKSLKLEPLPNEPPFSEYVELINAVQKMQRTSYPRASADSESLRAIIDESLQGDFPLAHWVFLADRSLPNEGRMKSVKLIQGVEGKRQIMLSAANYERIGEKIKPIFERCNLSLSTKQLEILLLEGIALINTGFLDLIKQDGNPDPNRVRGLAGMLLAARDYRNRYPDCLLVGIDDELARLWLRLGQRTPERCDLLALRKENERFVIECIEVKTTDSDSISDDSEIILHARDQIVNTLKACSEALPDVITGDDPLSAPRCEMLKEIFIRCAQDRTVNENLRIQWGDWLIKLFKQETNEINILFSGEVIRVLIGSNDPITESQLANEPFIITGRNLTEHRIQELIEGIPSSPPQHHEQTVGSKKNTKNGSNVDIGSKQAFEVESTDTVSPLQEANEPVNHSKIDIKKSDSQETPEDDLQWPPKLNALGMIGHTQAVSQLINQVNYSKASGTRFPDKLLVGPAGVGKSSLARAIARQLLNQEEILFNGADLRAPRQLINKLSESKKIPKKQKGSICVESCLIFIDEVHAISKDVATTLLSAMDDARITTIDGDTYDFNKVIIIMATTDSGKLSEAFTSRPHKTYLHPYTLHELAGIVWSHGKQKLNGYNLPQDVCYEIAARMKCQPRRAVRALSESLIPHFYSITHEQGESADLERIAKSITRESVAEFFEEQGIDYNGLTSLDLNYLKYLNRTGATSAENLQQSLGITNRQDFIEVDEYLRRLGLVEKSPGGRLLTPNGRRYLKQSIDLRDRISRNL